MSFLTRHSAAPARPSPPPPAAAARGREDALGPCPVGPDSSLLAFANKWHKARRRGLRLARRHCPSNKSVRNLAKLPNSVAVAAAIAEAATSDRSNSITLRDTRGLLVCYPGTAGGWKGEGARAILIGSSRRRPNSARDSVCKRLPRNYLYSGRTRY